MKEGPKKNKVMMIIFNGGKVDVGGPEEEIMKLRAELKMKDKRHVFVEVHDSLTADFIESLDIMPSQIGLIIVQDPTKAPAPKQGLFLPANQTRLPPSQPRN